MSSLGGFDLVGQIRAPLVGDIFTSYYDVGTIPNNTTIDLSSQGYGTASVALDPPLLWVDTDIPGEVEFIGNAHVEIASASLSFDAALDAFLTPTIQNVGGVETAVVSLNQMNLSVTVPSTIPGYQVLETLLSTGISSWLAGQSPFVVALPSIPKPFTKVQVVPIDDSAEMGRTNVSICLSTTNSGNTSKVEIFILPAEDFAVAFSAPLVQSTIDGAIATVLGGPLPRSIPGHSNVTLNSLSLSLIEGGFEVSGSATIDPGPCLPNIGIDFSGPVQVSLNPDGTVKVNSNITINESVWFWIVSCILGSLPLTIAEIVLQLIADNVLNSAISSGGSAALSGQNVFSTSLPQIGAGGIVTLGTTITRLTIHPDELVLGGSATLSP